jgi:MFS family permease
MPGTRRRLRLPPALQQRDFALYVAGIALPLGLGTQMVNVAIGWQVYSIHHVAFDLGLIGLLEFLPVFLLALPAGQLTDRLPRRAVLAASIVLLVAIAAALIVVSADGAHLLWPFLALAAANGVATALSFPAQRALPPMLVGRELLADAMAVRSVVNQGATVIGPALGGVLFAASPELAYGVALGFFICGLAAAGGLRVVPRSGVGERARERPLEALLAGIRFIRRTPVLSGAILLDLFAVLFGGAIALLPVFAQSILHVGPVGLGLLRSAPAVGAVIAGVLLVRRPLGAHSGAKLLACVGVFGASIVVFGLSRWFELSLAALALSGAADMVSVYIRNTTAALVTPDFVRGRVGSVESVFIGASNELGAFESGSAAALLGTVPSVIAGGGLTILIALSWTRLFPALARLDRMDELRPPDAAAVN